MSEVRVGQIWVDNDKRSSGRRLKVVEVSEHYAICRCLPSETRRTRISLKRFKPTSTGYRLESDGQ